MLKDDQVLEISHSFKSFLDCAIYSSVTFVDKKSIVTSIPSRYVSISSYAIRLWHSFLAGNFPVLAFWSINKAVQVLDVQEGSTPWLSLFLRGLFEITS